MPKTLDPAPPRRQTFCADPFPKTSAAKPLVIGEVGPYEVHEHRDAVVVQGVHLNYPPKKPAKNMETTGISPGIGTAKTSLGSLDVLFA